MTKYIVPSVSVSALFSSYYNGLFGSREKKIDSLPEAIKHLNENRKTQEAISFILNSDPEVTTRLIGQLNTRSIGALASYGWKGVGSVKVPEFDKEDEDEEDYLFEKLLDKFDLGDDFRAALDWLNRVPCDEGDLSCTDAWFGPRPSQTSRLHRVLQVLYLKTETPSQSVHLDPSAIVQFLYNMYTEYIEEKREIALLALKTLSNVALNDTETASRILQSAWLPLLSRMSVHGKKLEERLICHKVLRNALYSLGMIDYCLRSDVYEVHLGSEEPLVDIVLIHGLKGSVAYTWRQRDSKQHMDTECWPKDWLPIDIAEPIRIIGIDYPSYILQFSGTMESLQVRADRIAQQLTEAGVGRRPVIFICHSMGGLLAKKLCVDLPELAKKTAGILFIATPHRGSPIASRWAYEMLYPSEDVRFLRQSNELNRKLDEDFSEIADRIGVIASMVETRESNLIGNAKGIIVPSDSAVLGRGAVYHIEDVHHNVCKPSERSSPVYGVVLNFLRDSIQEAKKMGA